MLGGARFLKLEMISVFVAVSFSVFRDASVNVSVNVTVNAIDLVAVFLVPLRLRYRLAIDRSYLLALTVALVALHSEQHERRNDQQEQEHHHELVVLAEEIEH